MNFFANFCAIICARDAIISLISNVASARDSLNILFSQIIVSERVHWNGAYIHLCVKISICVKTGRHSTVLVIRFTVHLERKTFSCDGNYNGNGKCD